MAKEPRESDGRQWDGVLRREANITVRSVDEEKRSIRFLASTDSVDSHGDIVEQDWNLARYKKNPVVLWNHQSYGDDVVIGRSEDVRVTKDGLETTVVFAPAHLSERADKTFGMVAAGFLRAVSVGFRPSTVKLDEGDGRKDIYRLSGNELYEISVVPLPSNPDSVACSHGASEEREFLRRLAVDPQTKSTDDRAAVSNPEDNMGNEEAEKAADVKAAAAEKAAEDLRTQLKEALAARDEAIVQASVEKATREAAEERAAAAELVALEKAIDDLVGVKFYPSERDEQVELAKSVGLERVQSMASKRPDIALTSAPEVAGEKLGHNQTAPAPVEGKSVSEDIARAAIKAARAH